MPTRTIVLTALIASCVSSLVTLTVALLVLAPGIRAAPDLQAVQDVVRTRAVEIVDDKGDLRARLGTHSRFLWDDASLELYGPSQRSQLSLSAHQIGTRIVMSDGHGGPKLNLNAIGDGVSQGDYVALDIWDDYARDRLHLGSPQPTADPTYRPTRYGFDVHDANGRRLWRAPRLEMPAN